jgi:glucose-6-phosphate 1-dehydrogenase
MESIEAEVCADPGKRDRKGRRMLGREEWYRLGIQKGSVQFIMFYLEVAPQLYLDVIQWLGRAGSNTQGRATT